MKKTLFLACLLLAFGALRSVAQQVPSPSQFLGYELGTKFTPHHKVVQYFETVARLSNRVRYSQYGQTYEGRPLTLAYVSSEENMARIDEIRTDNLKRAQLMEGTPAPGKQVAIVWLSYNVHGNEASTTEASLLTLYALASTSGDSTSNWLKNTLVIIDPCLNPDGRDRYVNWYNQVGNRVPNPQLMSREHREPWPGGRVNHYNFDLNRDWAWQIQVESQQRMRVYREWMPHIHADFHEQFINSPYYFAPAAEPFHDAITQWQRQMQDIIGRNHARYFDQNGWLYFTKEIFDLLYPSYGDTYPTFNGAVGMTYEQAGHGIAGLAVNTSDGDTLTLQERIRHHYTTGLSTVEATSGQYTKVIGEFEKFFKNAVEKPEGPYKTYVVKANGNHNKQTALAQMLDKQGIRYYNGLSQKSLKGYSYNSGKKDQSFSLAKDDLVIPAGQPAGNLVRVLFEPKTYVSTPLTYDITAWNLPYAYGLEAYATATTLNGQQYTAPEPAQIDKGKEMPYAYLVPWNGLPSARFLSKLMQEGIVVRFATEPFTSLGKNYDRGTLIITRAANESRQRRMPALMESLSSQLNVSVYRGISGLVTQGKDFGSSTVGLLKAPHIAIVGGESTDANAFGSVWHFMERQLEYPVTVLETDYLFDVDLNSIDVLVMPNGYYSSVLNKQAHTALKQWVRQGGRLILLRSALNSFVGKEGYALERKKAPEKKGKDKAPDPSTLLKTYGQRNEQFVDNNTPGSVYQVRLDPTHPLAFGLGSSYYSLKTSSSQFAYLQNGWNVGVITNGTAQLRNGLVGSALQPKLSNTLVFGTQSMGSGQVVYFVDDPLFRSFWHNGKLLFANALFMVGQD